MLQAVGAERAVLAILLKKPEMLFDVDDILSEDDFTNSGSRIIFSLMRDLIIDDPNIELDHYTLISSAEEKGLKDFLALTNNGELLEALEVTKFSVKAKTLPRHVSAVKLASIKRRLLGTLDTLKDDVEDFVGDAIDLKNMVEEKVIGTMKVLNSGADDIEVLGDDFEEVINSYADKNAIVGLDIGLPRWQRDCGGIRNGTVTGIFARAKAGKSQFAAHAAVEVAMKQRLPILYLDTELQLRYQQMRVAGIMTGIQYERIESGVWKSKKEEVKSLSDAFKIVKDSPFYYKNIAGRSVSHVIPVIRKFFHKYVRESVGDNPQCLIVYDYIKLMNIGDLKHAQEYQVLGFLISAIHDVASELNIPILMLGQLNREALKVDSEATVAGSDRITHNVDSLTIIRKKRQEEIEVDGEMRGNHIMKCVLARTGSGHEYDDWVNINFEKSSGQFVEDKRNSEVRESLQQSRPIGDRLEGTETTQFGSLREE